MPVISMTGFGQARAEDSGILLSVELRSLNHRFLEVNCKLPPGYAGFEPRLIQLIKSRLERGRVDVSVIRKDNRTSVDLPVLKFNEEALANLLEIGKKAFALASVSSENNISDAVLQFLQRREVLEFVPAQLANASASISTLENEYPMFEKVLQEALGNLMTMRTAEGKALEKELVTHLSTLRDITLQIVQKGAGQVIRLQEKFTSRLEKLLVGVNVDATRLAQEIALLADRLDVSEELARLGIHCHQFEKMLGNSGGGGRKLDFLLQEMNREVNTLGSKSQDSEISMQVVEAKAVLEKLREQVQNIE